MVQPDRRERQPAAEPGPPPSSASRYKALVWARDRFEGSLAQRFLTRLTALDFADQAMLFGAGLLVSLLPFVILLSAFASQRIDDDISLRLGLDRRAAGIMDHLFTAAPATLNAATATSLLFLIFGMLAVASSLQQIYEKVFGQDHHRGPQNLGRLLIWIAVLGAAVVAESLAERPVSAAGGGWLAPLVTVGIMTVSPSMPTGISATSASTTTSSVVSVVRPWPRAPRSSMAACSALFTVTATTPSVPASSRARRLSPAMSPPW